MTAIRQGYDRWAAVYDHDANPLQALEEPLVRELLGEVRGLTVLDLGCGTGRHTQWLAAAGAIVTALDFSEAMLAEAQRKSEAARFIVHDLHQPLPFEEPFDRIVSGLVVEHLSNLDFFFAETHRVLKPGGRAVVSNIHPAMFLRGTQARFTDPVSGEVVQPGSFPHSISDHVLAAQRGGFKITDLREVAPNAAFAERYPRAVKYVDWPMLLVMVLER